MCCCSFNPRMRNSLSLSAMFSSKINKIGKFTSRCILYCSKFPTPIARLFDIADFQLSYRLSVLSGLSGFFSAFILTCTFTSSVQSLLVWVVRELKFGGMKTKIEQIIFTIKFSNVVCVASAICIYFSASAFTPFEQRVEVLWQRRGSLKIRTQWRGFRHAKQLLALLKGAKVSVAIECNQTSLCHCRLEFKSNYFWKRSLVCAMSHNNNNNNNTTIAPYSVVTNNNNNNISNDNEFQAITIST